MRVLILDEITVKPRQAAAFRQSFRQGYMPAAKRRGMTLEGAWQNPPAIDFAELPVTLYYLWSVEGAAGWWAQRMSRLPDGSDERFSKLDWWQGVQAMILARRRRMLSDQPEGE